MAFLPGSPTIIDCYLRNWTREADILSDAVDLIILHFSNTFDIRPSYYLSLILLLFLVALSPFFLRSLA